MKIPEHRWLLPAIATLVFSAVLFGTWRLAGMVVPLLTWRILPYLLGSAALYLFAHAVRATRIAVIAMPLLGLSFRTTFLLHLFVAPWSLIMPFKLDEAIRLYELHVTGKSWSRSGIALLIDRAMDGVVLLAMAAALLSTGRLGSIGLLGLTGLGLCIIIMLLFTLPVLLQAVQVYIFEHHYHDRALQMLRLVDYFRQLLTNGRATIVATAPFLAITTIGIWGMEIAAVAVLLAARPGSFASLDALEMLLLRVDTSWHVLLLGQAADPWSILLSVTFLAGLLVAFVPVTLLYTRRRGGEPLRSPAKRSSPIVLQRL